MSDGFHRPSGGERRAASKALAEAAGGQPRLWEGKAASRMMMSSPFRRGLCTGSSFQQTLRQRMREVSPSCPAGCLTPLPHVLLLPRLQELRAISQAGASESEAVVPAGLAQPKNVHEFRRKPRQGPQRRMVDHLLPPYVECNFRSLHFMMVRFPRVSDFPREKCAPSRLHPPPEHAVLGVRPLPSGWRAAAPDVTLPRPLAQGLPAGEPRPALPPLLQELPLRLSFDEH